jgi:cephalosporin hydroxylase
MEPLQDAIPHGGHVPLPDVHLPMEYNLSLPLSAAVQVVRRQAARATYFGLPAPLFPTDAWVYQELVHALRPRRVIMAGDHAPGAVLHMRHLLMECGGGKVVGPALPDATADRPGRVPLAVLRPRDHADAAALARAAAPLIAPGGYLIVEGTIDGCGLDDRSPSPSIYQAVEAFLAAHPAFEPDRRLESFVVTANPSGFLRRRGE